MSDLWQDVRLALRSLLKRPGLACVTIMVLALGIGACTVVFSVVYGLMFRPHPIDRDGRLTVVFQANADRGISDSPCRFEDFVDWRSQNTVFEELAAYQSQSLNLAGPGEPVRVHALRASPEIFKLLGLKPLRGRFFTSRDDQPGAERVAVVSAAFWQTALGADPNATGRDITIHGDVYAVVGIAPSDFDPSGRIIKAPNVWLPLARKYDRGTQSVDGSIGTRDLSVMGRRRAGVSLQQAGSELDGIAQRLALAHPDSNSGWGVDVKTVQMARLGEGGALALKFLSIAVAFVLFLVCFNVANLLLARAGSRGKEMAIRVALGAGRRRLLRQLLTESAVTAVIAGGLGALLALWGVQSLFVLSAELQGVDARHHPIRVDSLAMVFSLGAALASVVIFGLVPALQTSRCSVSRVLKGDAGMSGTGPHGQRLRSTLVAGEIAVALVLVVSTSLVVQSLINLRNQDSGYDPDGLLAASISLPEKTYPGGYEQTAFFERILSEIGRLPEVDSVAASDSPPLVSAGASVFCVEGRRVAEPSQLPETAVSTVTTDYWATMKTKLVSGRGFRDSDTAAAPPVALINETLARRFFSDSNPIGQRIKLGAYGDASAEWCRIVGVVRDSRRWLLDYAMHPQVYVPLQQNPRSSMVVMVRTTTEEPEALAGAVRQSVWRVDPGQPVYDIRDMEKALSLQFSSWHVFTGMLVVFCVVALVLAAVGTYGSMAYMVSRRTHEIGVRIALGAQLRDVLALVMRRGIGLTVLGLALGIPLAIGVARLLSSMLYRVTATHLPTLSAVVILLAAVALVACYVPARRAARLDAMVALKCDSE